MGEWEKYQSIIEAMKIIDPETRKPPWHLETLMREEFGSDGGRVDLIPAREK